VGYLVRIAVISDIHSNIYGLEAALKDIEKRRNIDEIICLGDIVGYYPFPNECVDLVREKCSISMYGNHDAGVVGDEPAFYFNPTAYEMITWTKKFLKKDNLTWLSKLPRKKIIERNGKKIYLVHGSPFQTFDYFVATDEKEWKNMLKEAAEKTMTDMLFVGHTHIPIKDKYKRFQFLNPGSIGQPRNGKPGAHYAIVNTSPLNVTMVHIKYDHKPVQEKMKELDLPKSLRQRLNKGH
jgi:putative phosphoesterase